MTEPNAELPPGPPSGPNGPAGAAPDPPGAAGPTLVCDACGRSRAAKAGADGLPRLAGGWKRIGGGGGGGRTLCDRCVAAEYRTVAVTLPIADCASHPWADFARVAHASFARVVRVKREVVRKCLESDPTTPAGRPLGRWTAPRSLYADARAVTPELSPGTTASLSSQVAALYKGRRLETHRGDRSVPAVRYPQPVPVRQQDYAVARDADGRLTVSFRLESTAVEGSARYLVRPLRAKHGRAYDVLEAVAAGTVQALELQLDARERGAEPGHAHGRRDGRTPGGARTQWAYALRLVVRLPRPPPRPASAGGTLSVRTGVPADAEAAGSPGVPLLVYRLDDAPPQPPVYMHHVRRQLLRCDREQARLRCDLKRELRVPTRHRRPVGDHQRRFADLRRRLNRSCVNDAAAVVVNFAVRRGAARLEYDDGGRAWAPSFDWTGLRGRVAELCRAHGIALAGTAADGTMGGPEGGDGDPSGPAAPAAAAP